MVDGGCLALKGAMGRKRGYGEVDGQWTWDNHIYEHGFAQLSIWHFNVSCSSSSHRSADDHPSLAGSAGEAEDRAQGVS